MNQKLLGVKEIHDVSKLMPKSGVGFFWTTTGANIQCCLKSGINTHSSANGRNFVPEIDGEIVAIEIAASLEELSIEEIKHTFLAILKELINNHLNVYEGLLISLKNKGLIPECANNLSLADVSEFLVRSEQ